MFTHANSYLQAKNEVQHVNFKLCDGNCLLYPYSHCGDNSMKHTTKYLTMSIWTIL